MGINTTIFIVFASIEDSLHLSFNFQSQSSLAKLHAIIKKIKSAIYKYYLQFTKLAYFVILFSKGCSMKLIFDLKGVGWGWGVNVCLEFYPFNFENATRLLRKHFF